MPLLSDLVLNLTPYPSPARVIIDSQSFSWLERGDKERGGFAPSHIFRPLKQNILRAKKMSLFERGKRG
jgi:hypothetical protein